VGATARQGQGGVGDRIMTHDQQPLPQPSLVSVYSGRECIGFVLKRATGFEAYTAAETTLGIFPTMKAAADTISKYAGEWTAA